MKKLAFVFFIILVSCTSELPLDSGERNGDFDIPLSDALSTLTEFLESENLHTKASSIKDGRFYAKKWNAKSGTKGSDTSPASLYCIDFSNNLGSAVLAADDRIPDKILCVTDSGKILPEDLDDAYTLILSNPSSSQPFDDCDNYTIGGCDESFANILLCRRALSADYNNAHSDINNGSRDNVPLNKFGPLLHTKWGQSGPFNRLMNGSPVGCVPVASAQLIYHFHDSIEVDPWFFEKKCSWDTIGTVRHYLSSSYIGTEEAQNQVSHFMYEVKLKCNMQPSQRSGTASGVEACMQHFGFVDIYHDFAHFGGNAHDDKHLDDVIEMIKKKKPVIMLAYCMHGWPWDWSGHAYVIDGYKSDSTGEYLHINWGWNGVQDGYYAVGCFDESNRAGIEDGVDSGDNDSDPSNFDMFHYYVHYEI